MQNRHKRIAAIHGAHALGATETAKAMQALVDEEQEAERQQAAADVMREVFEAQRKAMHEAQNVEKPLPGQWED